MADRGRKVPITRCGQLPLNGEPPSYIRVLGVKVRMEGERLVPDGWLNHQDNRQKSED
jgi:hypothetical protein